MKNITQIAIFALLAIGFQACDKKNDNVATPNVEDNFPQQIVLADEGDGDLEDNDEVEIVLTLTDRVDPKGENLSGVIVPLSESVKVSFELLDPKGFTNWSDYMVDGKAFYEIDDCITSEDQNIDLNFVFNPTTGKGSVTFPKGIEELILAFEVDGNLFDNSSIDSDRGFSFRLTGIETGSNTVVNTNNVFEYKVLDDDVIYGSWVSSPNADDLAGLKALFGGIDSDIEDLEVADIKELEVEFEYEEIKFKIVLNATELVDDCGTISPENIEIEIEGEYDELEEGVLSGEFVFIVTFENEDGTEDEIEYTGEFEIVGNVVTLNIETEDSGVITLVLEK